MAIAIYVPTSPDTKPTIRYDAVGVPILASDEFSLSFVKEGPNAMKSAIQSSFPGEVIVDFGDASEKVLLRTACKDRVKPAKW